MVYVFHQPVYDAWFLVTSTFLSILSMQCHADIRMFRASTNQQLDSGYRTYPAKFGAPLDPEGLEGFITYNSSDGTGCNASLILPPPSIYANHRWILLVERGNCSFVEKVRNAQRKQYDMAIVFNNVSSLESPMHGKDADDITIPTVFVSQRTGHIIIKKFQYFNDVYVVVTEDPGFPFDINGDLIIPFAIIVFVCFITLLSFSICKCIRDRRRARRHRLPASSLRKIPIEKFSSKTSRYETCAICLDDYIDGERLRILPCSHAYHAKCIDPWLTRNRRVCPICKRKVLAANEPPLDGSDSDSDSDNERTPLVRAETSQDVHTRRMFIHSLLAPLQQAWHHEESASRSNGSDNSSGSGSLTDSEGSVPRVIPASLGCSINSPDVGSTSNVLNSYSFPGSSSVVFDHSRYNIQRRNDVDS